MFLMGPVNRHTFFTVSVIRTGDQAGAVDYILKLISEVCNESITYTIIMSGIFPVLSVGMLLLILLLFRLIGHGAYCGTGRGNS